MAPGAKVLASCSARYSQVRAVAGAKLAALIVLITASGCMRKQVQQVYLPASGRRNHHNVPGADKVNILIFSLKSAIDTVNLTVDVHGVTRVGGAGHACDGLVVDLPAGGPKPSDDVTHFVDDWLVEVILTHVAKSGKSQYLGSIVDTGFF